jgi:hypothetical protein
MYDDQALPPLDLLPLRKSSLNSNEYFTDPVCRAHTCRPGIQRSNFSIVSSSQEFSEPAAKEIASSGKRKNFSSSLQTLALSYR